MRLRIHSSLTPIRSAIGALTTTVDGRLVPTAEIAALRVRTGEPVATEAVAVVSTGDVAVLSTDAIAACMPSTCPPWCDVATGTRRLGGVVITTGPQVTAYDDSQARPLAPKYNWIYHNKNFVRYSGRRLATGQSIDTIFP